MARPRRNKAYLTTGEAAGLLNLSRRTVTKYCMEGRIRATQHPLTRQWEIAEEALSEFIRMGDETNSQSEKTYKVLVVDDEPSVIGLIRSILEGSGIQMDIDSASDGYQAFLRIGKTIPDLLILDIQMPNLDGNKVLQTLANEPNAKGIKTLVVTGHPEVFHPSAQPHADAILEKPFSPDQLRKCVRELLGIGHTTGKKHG